jgi:hypothetical protein
MTDMNILVTGIVVFGLMFVGLILTVLEFQQISKADESRSDSNPSRPGSEPG